MKRLMMTAAVLAMVCAGCSSGDDSNDTDDKDMETEQTLTIKMLAGVWRDGDFFVSFSEDGYLCCSLNERNIVCGNFSIDGTKILVMGEFYGSDYAWFDISEIDKTTLSYTVQFTDGEFDSQNPKTKTMKM